MTSIVTFLAALALLVAVVLGHVKPLFLLLAVGLIIGGVLGLSLALGEMPHRWLRLVWPRERD